MARVLALSSHVAFGTVGLAVIVPGLHALGHEVVAVPTVVLSSHPGYGRFAGEQIAPAVIREMTDALDANGWLAGCGGVLTGYLPTPAHVEAAAAAVARVRKANPGAIVLCDPVCGDDPDGLYLDPQVPAAITRLLLPQCTIATPNRFEVSCLAGTAASDIAGAVEAARALGVPSALVTSVPASEGRLATLLVERSTARAAYVRRVPHAPHGTGDLLAALYLGHLLNGAAPDKALGSAVAAVEAAITASGPDELVLARAGALWAGVEPLATVPL
jgi:pyridoxine kinase